MTQMCRVTTLPQVYLHHLRLTNALPTSFPGKCYPQAYGLWVCSHVLDAPVYQCVDMCILMFTSMLHADACVRPSVCVRTWASFSHMDVRTCAPWMYMCKHALYVRACVYMCVHAGVHSKQPMPQLDSLRRALRVTMQCKDIPASKNRHDHALAKDIYVFHTT